MVCFILLLGDAIVEVSVLLNFWITENFTGAASPLQTILLTV